MRDKIIKVTVIFFLLMMVLTVVSKKANEFAKAGVTVAGISSSRLDYSMQAEGNIERENTVPINVLANQILEKINVKEGEQAAEGEELFSVSVKELDSQISAKIREIEKLNLEINDARSAKETESRTWQANLAQARENYDTAVSSGDAKISELEMQLAAAKQKDQEEMDSSLITELEEACGVAVEERENAVSAAKQALDVASVPPAANSNEERLLLDLEEKEEERMELEALKKVDGKIYSPVSGVVAKVNGEAGMITSEGSILLITELSSGSRLRASITKEQKAFLKIGDFGTVEGIDEDGNTKLLEEVEIISIQNNSETGGYEIIADLKKEGFAYGSTAAFYVEMKSRQYACCLPLSALRVDSGGGYYVLVVEEQNTVLGTELIAKQINVEVIEKNGSMAALKEGTLDSSQKIIAESSKAIENGSRVKLIESNEYDEE